MIVNFHGEFSETEEILIKIGDRNVSVNQLNPCASFDLQLGKEYEVIIEQPVATNRIRPITIILSLLAVLFRGMFGIIESYGDDVAWYSKIKAFCIISKFSITAIGTEDYYFKIVDSKYDDSSHSWSYPAITLDCDISISSSYVFNHYEFTNMYYSFAYRIISIACIILLLFAFLLYQAVKNNIMPAMISVLAIIVLIVVFLISILILQYKKMKKLYYESYDILNK